MNNLMLKLKPSAHAVAMALAAIVLMATPATSLAVTVLTNGVPTIDLPADGRRSSPMAVAYHPGFDRYYGADVGSPDRRAWVWDNAGAIVQNFPPPIGVDYRGVNYNPNTGGIEVVTYDALNGDGGNVRGLMTMGLDGAGLYTGASVNTLVSLPGLASSQTIPSYNPALDVFYSRDSGGTINVVNRSDGALSGTINLDLAAAGNPSLRDWFAGFDTNYNALVLLDDVLVQAVVFDLSGAFLGTSQLSGLNTTNSNGNTAYTNGQIFIFDSTQGSDGVYHGFNVLIPEPSTLALATLGLAGVGYRRRWQF